MKAGVEIIGDIAQLGERLPCKQEVAGSIPTISTIAYPPSRLDFQTNEVFENRRGDTAK